MIYFEMAGKKLLKLITTFVEGKTKQTKQEKMFEIVFMYVNAEADMVFVLRDIKSGGLWIRTLSEIVDGEEYECGNSTYICEYFLKEK